MKKMIVLMMTILLISLIATNSFAYTKITEENIDTIELNIGDYIFVPEEVQQMIEGLKERDKLEELVNGLESRISNLEEQNDMLEQENIRLINRVDLLENKVDNKDERIALLNQQLEQKDIIISEYEKPSIPFQDELKLLVFLYAADKVID